MAGTGKVREGWKRITLDLSAEDEKELRIWAAESDMSRSELIRTELEKTISRHRKKASR